jgi:hypothetical protein
VAAAVVVHMTGVTKTSAASLNGAQATWRLGKILRGRTSSARTAPTSRLNPESGV